MDALWKYFLVYISSAVKFIFGPTIGIASGFNVFVTGSLTALGMMTSVYAFTYFGEDIRNFTNRIFKKQRKKIFSKKSRRFVVIWRKYGVQGIAFLTPILLTPIGGTVVANAFGGKREDIIKYMWFSCVFWAYIITWLAKFACGYIPFLDC